MHLLALIVGVIAAATGLAVAQSAYHKQSILPTTYDEVFNRHRGYFPIQFLRALAKKESDFKAGNTKGGAWGLMEVTPVVLQDFNERHATRYTMHDVLNPNLNVQIALEELDRIVRSYAASHPRTRNMLMDWGNPEFVTLLVMGWNSGWSEERGVGRVVRYLESNHLPVTGDNVARYASTAGAAKWIAERGSGWAKSVTRLYYEDLRASNRKVNV